MPTNVRLRDFAKAAMAAAALTLAAIVWLLTQNLLASLAVIAFEVVARALIHAIGARGEPSRTALDEVNEGGGGI